MPPIMFGSRKTTGAINIPATAPILLASPQPSATIQPTLMPTSLADSGVETAPRIARPILVNPKKQYRNARSRPVTPIIPASCELISSLPTNLDDPNGDGNSLIVKSHVIPATLFTIANSAMNPATLVSIDAFASGRNRPRSIATPAPKEIVTVRMKAGQ